MKEIKFKLLLLYWASSVLIVVCIYYGYSWKFDSNLLLKVTKGVSLTNELLRLFKITGSFMGLLFGAGVIFSLARRFNFKFGKFPGDKIKETEKNTNK